MCISSSDQMCLPRSLFKPLKGLLETPNYFNKLARILGCTARLDLCVWESETDTSRKGSAPGPTSEPHTRTRPLGGAGEIRLGFADRS